MLRSCAVWRSVPILPLLWLTGSVAAVAQDPTPVTSLPVAEVLAVLDTPLLDQARFLALVQAGPAAVPGLLRAVGDGHDVSLDGIRRRVRALRCLRLIGPVVGDAAVPALLGAIAQDASRDDVDLLITLAELAPGVSDRPAMAAFARTIRIANPEPRVDMDGFRRWVATMRFWYDFHLRLAWSPGDDVKQLEELLHDEDPLRRRAAAQRLGTLGAKARPALDALVVVANTKKHPRVTRIEGLGSLTADFHDLVSDAAAIAIARIDPAHPEARRGLTLLLRADAPRERFAALMAMVPGGDQDPSVAVLDATSDDDLRVAAEAVTTLVRLGDRRPQVLARLRVLAASPHDVLATCAAAALRALER